MRYVSTFSGIEAASVAWGPLGWEPLAFAEIEPFPCAVLEARWPGVPNLGDVTGIDWNEFKEEHGSVDLVVGGSPCQSFSIAGGRDSLDGESRLMFEYIRAVEELRPTWLLWENVPGVLSVRDNAFGQLLGELSELGYGLAWRVLDAQFFGVAQRRRRVFLVGHLGAGGASAAVLFDAESVSGNLVSSREKRAQLARAAGGGAESCGFKWHQGVGAGSLGYESEQSPTITADWHVPAVMAFAQNTRDEVRLQGDGDVCGALSASPGMKQQTYICMADATSNAAIDDNLCAALKAHSQNEPPIVATSSGEDVVGPLMARDGKRVGSQFVRDGKVLAEPSAEGWTVRRLTPMECERLQGFPDGWTDVPYRGAEHPPDAPRYKALGNSMAVPVMRWIGERMEIVDGIASGAR